jgi:hypothetical protein
MFVRHPVEKRVMVDLIEDKIEQSIVAMRRIIVRHHYRKFCTRAELECIRARSIRGMRTIGYE